MINEIKKYAYTKHTRKTIFNNGFVSGAAAMFAIYSIILIIFVFYIVSNHEIIPK